MAKEITLNELRIFQSGNFLCDNLPENFTEMKQEEIDDFIVECVWHPFENDDPSDIWDSINNAALDLKAFLEKKDIKVTGD